MIAPIVLVDLPLVLSELVEVVVADVVERPVLTVEVALDGAAGEDVDGVVADAVGKALSVSL